MNINVRMSDSLYKEVSHRLHTCLAAAMPYPNDINGHKNQEAGLGLKEQGTRTKR